jgi:pimeloyl-ACP methyl ester carboxylesterase
MQLYLRQNRAALRLLEYPNVPESRPEEDVPHARKVVIRDAGHMVNMEKPEEFNREVLEFLPGGSSLAKLLEKSGRKGRWL